MASLKEIKGRIASVSSTIKVTSAMKMVASAKLRVAQKRIGNMVPYETMLRDILLGVMEGVTTVSSAITEERDEVRNVAVLCFASNSSLCGGFNNNAIRVAAQTVDEYVAKGIGVTVFSVGRKMAMAMRKKGYVSPADYSELSASPTYEAAAALARELMEGYEEGRYDKVELVYNHFKSGSSQPTVRETYLPLSLEASLAAMAGKPRKGSSAAASEGDAASAEGSSSRNAEFIYEPSRESLLETLLPKVSLLKVYTVLLDASAAEHAARTMAMQMATDNGNDLLADLTLQYNKGRQQKITNELLDIAGGSLQ